MELRRIESEKKLYFRDASDLYIFTFKEVSNEVGNIVDFI